MISILLALRKNSKFMAKFMLGFMKNTKDFNNVELLVMAHKDDTWNQDLFEYYKTYLNIYYEDWGVGKNGRHYFYNELASKANGQWLWHMCDDHYLLDGYDEYLTDYISGKGFNPKDIHMIVPRVENSGSISHILSRGWYETTGRIGMHGNIDSYLNDVADKVIYKDKVIHYPEQAVLVDYTVDPTIMTPEHSSIQLREDFKTYSFDSLETKLEIEKDALALYKKL